MIKDRIRILEAIVDDLTDRVRTLEYCQPECCGSSPAQIEVGEYVTRDGNRAVVYTVNGLDPEYPVVGEVVEEEGVSNHCWTSDGHYHSDRTPYYLDLFLA